MGVKFVLIFKREGTDIEAMKAFFMEAGATDVQVLYDYIIIDDDPDKAVSFFVDMPLSKYLGLSLRGLKMKQAPGLPAYHYVAID